MLFIGLMHVKAGTNMERIPKRLQFQYPEGMRVIAEYWLQKEDPHVIIIFEADSPAPALQAIVYWDQYFDIDITPAITAEEGLEMAKQMMG